MTVYNDRKTFIVQARFYLFQPNKFQNNPLIFFNSVSNGTQEILEEISLASMMILNTWNLYELSSKPFIVITYPCTQVTSMCRH